MTAALVLVFANMSTFLEAMKSDGFSIAEVGSRVQVPPLELAPPAIVEGVVRDENGGLVPGVAVWLRDWDLDRNGQRSGAVTEVITEAPVTERHLPLRYHRTELRKWGPNAEVMWEVTQFEIVP